MYLAGLGAMVLLGACEKNVTVEIPATDPKIVMFCNQRLNTDFTAAVTRTRGILDPVTGINGPVEPFRLNNATVLMYENDVLLDTLKYDAASNTYSTRRARRPLPGRRYRLKASAPGYADVEAISAVPPQMVVSSFQYVKNVRTNADGDPMNDINISFNDPPGEKNFYLVRVRVCYFNGGIYSDAYCVSTKDRDVEANADFDPTSADPCYDGGRLLMKDDNFNGRLKQLKLSVNDFEVQTFVDGNNGRRYLPFVEIWQITEDYYKYLKSDNAFNISSGNPFAEPVLIYTNVKNGWGVFSVYTAATDSLR